MNAQVPKKQSVQGTSEETVDLKDQVGKGNGREGWEGGREGSTCMNQISTLYTFPITKKEKDNYLC